MDRSLRIALIADTYPPLRTSGAVQMRDLSREFARQGHAVTVFLPASDQSQPWKIDEIDGVRVMRLKAPRTKDIGYVRRTLHELLMPFAMRLRLSRSPLANEKWDGVVWYSPSIFFGPLANSLKKSSNCKSYLIVRDIFPDWAADMGLMNRAGLPFRFFDAIARYQYAVADIIGIQTAGNSSYFNQGSVHSQRELEILQNWLDQPANTRCSIRLAETKLANKKVLVYAGNMGIAQGVDILLALAEKIVARADVGFLFVGRGSEVARLKNDAQKKSLGNVLFFDEIHPDEIPDLYAQCHIGLIALDPRHSSHNIPGKFLTYMQCGLPVLASVNKSNDLVTLIQNERVGLACDTNQIDALCTLANQLLDQIDTDRELGMRCKSLFQREYSSARAVRQIVNALKDHNANAATLQ